MSAPFDFFKYEQGELRCEGVSLAEIAKRVGTPAYVYSAEAFLQPLRELQRGLASVDHLICFALKSNSNTAILKMLGQAGAGMDLVSSGELHRCKTAGISADKLVFSGVGKTRQEMIEALRYEGRGILAFHVESLPELELLNAVAKELGVRARVSLRFNPDVDAKTHPYIATGLKKNKFGLRKAEVLAVAKNLSRYPSIDWVGLSTHIGSQLLSLAPLEDAFARLRELMDQVNDLLPAPLTLIDLGGGLGITYKKEKPPTIAKYTQLILRHFGPKAKLKHPVKILIEPGRTLSGNAGALVTQLIYKKDRAAKDFLIVDAGMNDLIRPSLYGSYHEVVPVRAPRKGKLRKSDIVGPVCESADCFASDRNLPADLSAGDLLAILSAGAYGFAMTSQYNSRPRPAEVLVQNGQMRVIRDRETYEDLVRGERL